MNRKRSAVPLIDSFLIIIAIIICFLFKVNDGSANSAQSLKSQALRYYKGIGTNQDYQKALALYLQAAGLGDADSQYISGAMLVKGMGAPENRKEGLQLLLNAAQKGKTTPESEQVIGEAYLLGNGLPKNYNEAVRWYKKAAENGNVAAMNELGFMYFTGKGVERNPETGGKYFLQAARSGLRIAQYNVGIMYFSGDGSEGQDLIRSYGWLNLAASQGYSQAIVARNYLKSILSPRELKMAQELTGELATSQEK